MKKNLLIKKEFTFGIILIILIVCPVLSAHANNTIPTQRSRVTILYVGGSGPGNYTKIQDAIDNATSGDTIFVYDDSSPYIERVLINKSINLVGENKDTTMIYGSTGTAVFIQSGSQTNISGFTLTNNGLNDAVRISWSHSLIITDNIIFQGRHGIYAYHASNSLIKKNTIHSNKQKGLYMMYSSNIIYSNNTIRSNGAEGIMLENAYNTNENVTVSNNIILGNGGHGILIKGSYNKITGNTLLNNVNYGICLTEAEASYTDYNIIQGNHFLHNSYGIYIKCPSYPPGHSCENNLIHHNNFMYNTANAYDENTNIWDNGYVDPFDPLIDGGNYWTDYTGHDYYHGPEQNIPGSDGIGDTPKEIAGGSNQDHYPLMYHYYNGTHNPPDAPLISGPTSGKIEQKYDFTIILQNSRFECLYYYIDWGDGTHEKWVGPYTTGEVLHVNHTWYDIGSFLIKAKVKDIFNEESAWSDPCTIVISQEPPQQPIITGPRRGKANCLYNYSFVTTDPESHDVRYFIDWGDDSNTGWIGPFPSGQEQTMNHDWDKQGIYKIQVKAKDKYDAESEWATLTVTMPFSYEIPVLQFWMRLLERFPQAFPLLRNLFGY
ncbi:MAG: right-handed parallel beta-helix repeat-containing protein [Candidatus Thermoplasmatota archaeon]